MLYYFYYLYFEYEVGKNKHGHIMSNEFDIGYFSTRAKAQEKIQFYKNLSGFKNHPLDCFKIKKLGVKFETKIKDKSLVDFFVLSHYYSDNDYFDYPTVFPPFATEKEAKEKMEKIKNEKPFCDYPDEFAINQFEVDRYTGWTEGFRELDDDEVEGMLSP